MSAPTRPDIATRLPENPLIRASDVPASRPELEVVSVFNAAAARVGDEIVLLLRVAEQPRTDIEPPRNAQTLVLDGPEPRLRSLPAGYRMNQLVGMCFLDSAADPPTVIVAYVPRDLAGLDLSDPRTIRYHYQQPPLRDHNGGYVDYLAQMSHLRVARSSDGVHFTVDPEPALAPPTQPEDHGLDDPPPTPTAGGWPPPSRPGSRRPTWPPPLPRRSWRPPPAGMAPA